MTPPPYVRKRHSSLRLLFSTDYSQFVTTRLLKTGYRAVIAVTVFTVLLWIWIAWALPEWIGWGIPVLVCVFAPFIGLVWLSLVRVTFEYLIVVFGIGESLYKVDAKVEYLARVTHEKNKAVSDAQPTRR